MTRINVLPVESLTDQHLMAEYRELPMVMGSAKRSDPDLYIPSIEYTLNGGHVKFFYNKKEYLIARWTNLIAELRKRGYNIDPESRIVDFTILDKFPQVSWMPNDRAFEINKARIDERISAKPDWYKFYGEPLKKVSKYENSC